MRHYVGLDVSMKTTSICLVNQAGNVVYETETATDPKTIARILFSLELEIEKVGLESGQMSGWLTKQLRAEGLPAICIDSRMMAAILKVQINKNDRNDARGIAQAMRCDNYREVHVKSDQSVDLKTPIRCRKALVKQRTHLMLTVRGLLKDLGIRLGVTSKAQFVQQVEEMIEPLIDEVKFAVCSLLKAFEVVCAQIKELERLLKAAAAANPRATLLMTIPGVGPITALSYLAEIDDPDRFEHSRSVGAYVGMTPRQYSSGETNRQGRISKCGPQDLRCLLMEAGLVCLTRSHKWSRLKAWGMKIQARHGTKKAAVAMGRKMAVIMHRMLVTNEEFRYGDPAQRKKQAVA